MSRGPGIDTRVDTPVRSDQPCLLTLACVERVPQGVAPMGAPDVNEAEDVGRSMRRRLHELAARQHWVHHVGDLDSGEVLTTQLDRPVMPLSRAERLSR